MADKSHLAALRADLIQAARDGAQVFREMERLGQMRYVFPSYRASYDEAKATHDRALGRLNRLRLAVARAEHALSKEPNQA